MDKKLRIAVINSERCKPKKCERQCKTECPVVKMGKLCVVVSKKDKTATISEELCNGCGICTKKCPFDAIKIINLPISLDKETIHRYGQNGFKLHRLPTPKQGQVLGLIGKNGTGKSTALKILAGKLEPNFNKSETNSSLIMSYFKGTELQNYFDALMKKNFKTAIKPQYVDIIPKFTKGTVRKFLDSKNERNMLEKIIKNLDLEPLLDKNISILSGGELQRFAIAVVSLQNVDCYMFDEPSSYLDIKQRLRAAEVIRSIVEDDSKKYVICVEHDIALLDYLCDTICMLYGIPSAYGIVSLPMSTTNGINVFLDGYSPSENMRFRDYEISFKFSNYSEETDKKKKHYTYPSMLKELEGFKLNVKEGNFSQSEITVLLGENGTGKTTFIKMLLNHFDSLKISYKPQIISRNFNGTVRELLNNKLKSKYLQSQFQTEVYKPLDIDPLLDLEISSLSGGELQRVALCLCLGKEADVYLIDEPSAYLDCEHRLEIGKMIKRFVMHNRKTAFVVEHDFILASYLADKVILFEGVPSKDCEANSPQNLEEGMNKFLKHLNITFRRDENNWRPRINKQGSVKDTEQKTSGKYFLP
jgi:ATP-binding cassette, sub-family E, member 1